MINRWKIALKCLETAIKYSNLALNQPEMAEKLLKNAQN